MRNRNILKSPVKKTKDELAEISRQNGRQKRNRQKDAIPKVKALKLPEGDNKYDYIADIYSPRAKIAPEIKLKAAQAYLVTGNIMKAERISGVPHQTISDWKNNSEWWPTVMTKLRKEKQEELDAAFTKIIELATDNIENRLLEGDEVITKDGDKIRKLVTGRDMATMLGIVFDKRAIGRGEATSISGKVDMSSQLDVLKEEFAKMARKDIEKTVVRDITPQNGE